MDIDLLTLANLLLCLTIVGLGLLGYRRSKHTLPLMLAGVFALFAVSHLMILVGLFDGLELVVFGIRVAGYALVIYLLYRYVQVLDIF
ncbi:MAG TPA: hypothetical protein P5202_05160 [Methanomassiliicoccales archaeon]|nr:hypothetical protein [Methanomassiliicoccales archaeon]HNX47522.1 hypothetical protein [Methanomassiliicoccales archaeon]HPR98094.1 hypothetical protein [Methanomassiliicoccales archaeon]HSA35938.1 hypothetical protein [Methanomassiliicoccales archaeon]